MLDHMIRVCLVSQETTKLSPKVAAPFHTLTTVNEVSYCFTTSPALEAVVVPEFGHPDRSCGDPSLLLWLAFI